MIRSCGAFSAFPRAAGALGSSFVVASALLAVMLALPAQASDEAAVGQVSLLIGEAKLVRKDGSSVLLRQGASIAVGDRIETAGNGHVHVRFVDKAMISVRPESVLEVQAYRYDAARPQDSEVRLKMAQGVGRSISGAATDADKSRFRLNTPIAAIGVRGTDFIVQASATDVRATVASGAIVLSALGNGCTAEGLGPCSGRAAQLLSADMGRMMVELRHGERVPRVVPAVDSLLASSAPSLDSRNAARAAALAAAQPGSTDPSAQKNDRAAVAGGDVAIPGRVVVRQRDVVETVGRGEPTSPGKLGIALGRGAQVTGVKGPQRRDGQQLRGGAVVLLCAGVGAARLGGCQCGSTCGVA